MIYLYIIGKTLEPRATVSEVRNSLRYHKDKFVSVVILLIIADKSRIIFRSSEKDRSSRPELFCKKDVLRNFAKSTEKHLRQSLFFNKVAV